MAPHSSTLAWTIPWMEEPGRLVVHGVATSWTRVSDFTFTFYFHALEEEMATHSSVLAWRIPGTGEPSGLLSMGSHRVGHDWSDLAAAATLPATRHLPMCSVSHSHSREEGPWTRESGLGVGTLSHTSLIRLRMAIPKVDTKKNNRWPILFAKPTNSSYPIFLIEEVFK